MPERPWHQLLDRRVSRRGALAGGLAAVMAGAATPAAGRDTADAEPPAAGLPFSPIAPSTCDDLVLPEGYRYHVVRAYGDDIGNGHTFGYNCDYTAFLPIDLPDGGESSEDGLLVVNHEYPHAVLQHVDYHGGPKTEEQIRRERVSLGVSIFRVKRRRGGEWACVSDPRNRRVDGYAPCELTGLARGSTAVGGATRVSGTVGNCSGGVTPWGTVLSCEENVDDYAAAVADKGHGWGADFPRAHYGWVVEIDPFDPSSTPRKHTAMGRFRHENVAVHVRARGRVVAYMGDDKLDSCVFKFVSRGRLSPTDRAANMRLLEDGDLYAADFQLGRWVLLDYEKEPALREAAGKNGAKLFSSQADVVADAPRAALALKATPVDRPEDLEIHPLTGDVYVALTNNAAHGNFHGQIIRLREDPSDPARFEWDVFAVGGRQSGFSSPDNLLFDEDGNLWMVTDVSSERLRRPQGTEADRGAIYRFLGNNSMFFFRTQGPDAGRARLFASGPVECELTGPCWTPDGRTLFLSVQHPGEETADRDKPTSRWPAGRGPRPAVVAVSGFRGFRNRWRPFYGGDWTFGSTDAAAAVAPAHRLETEFDL